MPWLGLSLITGLLTATPALAQEPGSSAPCNGSRGSTVAVTVYVTRVARQALAQKVS